MAGAQIVGGLSVPIVRRFFSLRTNAIFLAVALESVILVGHRPGRLQPGQRWAWAPSTWPSRCWCCWALVFAIAGPIRQAFLNGLIPSEQRATVLSFDSLMGSVGGAVAQPALGRVADVSGYAASYLVSGAVSALALPFVLLARNEKAPSDPIDENGPVAAVRPGPGSAARRMVR